MKERSLILLKPDTVQRALIGEIISRFEKTGLKIVAMKMVYASKELAGEHYADEEEWLLSVGKKSKAAYEKRGVSNEETERQIGERIRKALMDYITMSPVVALIVEGHNAVKTIRKLVGETSPESSAPGTIRGDYAHETYFMADNLNRPIQNLIHASGTPQEGEREIKVWFKEEEVHSYMRVDEGLIYRKVG